MTQLQELSQRLVDDHFSWGQEGNPREARPATPEERRRQVAVWLEGQTRPTVPRPLA